MCFLLLIFFKELIIKETNASLCFKLKFLILIIPLSIYFGETHEVKWSNSIALLHYYNDDYEVEFNY